MAQLTTQFSVQPQGAQVLAALDPGSASTPAVTTAGSSGLYRVPASAGVAVSVNGTPRLIAAPGHVAVVGNAVVGASAVVASGQVVTGGSRRVDGMPRRLPTWQNLGMYADPPGAKLLLTMSNVATYQQTVTTWGPTRQLVYATRPTYVNTDPLDAEPAIAFDRTAVQSLSGTPITMNCETNGGLTFIIMFKFTGTVSNYEGPFYSAANGGNFYLERRAAENSMNFVVRNGATALTNVQILNTVRQEQWNVFAFRYVQIAGTWTLQGFRNGVKVVESTAANPLINHTMSPFIGIGNFNGSIRYLGIWDRPLSDAELAKVTEAARIYPDLQGVAPILRVLQGSRDSCLVEPASDMLMPGPSGFPAIIGLAGAVLLPDGRVFCVPYSYTNVARLVDPRTNTVTSVTMPFTANGNAPFLGGVLLPNGNVYMVPRYSTYALLFDPVTGTATTAGGTLDDGISHQGAVLLQDGRVFMSPYSATYALIYDATTNTLSTVGAGQFQGNGALGAAVLMADGNVFCVPRSGTTARIFNPLTNAVSTPNVTFTGSLEFNSGVLMADGSIFCVPYGSNTARIYDPVAQRLSTPSGTYTSAGYRYQGGVLLPCGRIAMIPYNATVAVIYDPATDTLTTAQGTISSPDRSYYGGLLLPDGRVFMVPSNKTQALYLVTGGPGLASIPNNILLSPWMNNK